MNQDQRKFLIERVNKTFEAQKKKIEQKTPIKPSLNNYLVAACLDDSVQFNDIAILKQKIRKMVLQFGSSDKLINEGSNNYSYGNSKKKENTCEIVADDLFIIPQAYQEALAEYNSKLSEVTTEIEALEAQKDTILLKVQIGSNQVLDKLITQVDNLADLNIMNSQFLLA